MKKEIQLKLALWAIRVTVLLIFVLFFWAVARADISPRAELFNMSILEGALVALNGLLLYFILSMEKRMEKIELQAAENHSASVSEMTCILRRDRTEDVINHLTNEAKKSAEKDDKIFDMLHNIDIMLAKMIMEDKNDRND